MFNCKFHGHQLTELYVTYEFMYSYTVSQKNIK